eukprot:TRINITY_DN19088_c0_g1_i1.p2 TRINITY_DN19088_c0_g1~~TRINITY_DN19088_c0_g1_i1.p2  ORF type:complete len:203 (+),score=58.61 TRINITY_DN19088_c0_g1_i1:79-609(+)
MVELSKFEDGSSIIVGLCNMVVGAYAIYAYACDCVKDGSSDSHLKFNLPKFFLSAYLCFFGGLLTICGLPSVRRWFTVPQSGREDPYMGFLGSAVTRAAFVVFVGSMALGLGKAKFGTDDTPYYLPFLVGIVTLAHAFLFSFASCCTNQDADDRAAAGASSDAPPTLAAPKGPVEA